MGQLLWFKDSDWMVGCLCGIIILTHTVCVVSRSFGCVYHAWLTLISGLSCRIPLPCNIVFINYHAYKLLQIFYNTLVYKVKLYLNIILPTEDIAMFMYWRGLQVPTTTMTITLWIWSYGQQNVRSWSNGHNNHDHSRFFKYSWSNHELS